MPQHDNAAAPLRCPCRGACFTTAFSYTASPAGEVAFQFSSAESYRREVRRCQICNHFVSVHAMDASALYTGDYMTSTYGPDGIRAAFDRIVALDASQSDNQGRVRRINAFASAHFRDAGPRTVLDVGSGLGVFVHAMKATGWSCTALDPDARSVHHAREVVGVNAVQADFLSANGLGRFDAITFNKVLEHVADPIALLEKSATHLVEGGFVYAEVPDGEAASADSPGREEFFIDHAHVFSAASVVMMARRAGFEARAVERLREPSGKYTLFTFIVPSPESAVTSDTGIG